MTGRPKQKRKKYNSNWGGAREQAGRPPITDDSQKKHTKSFWVTDAEAEALTQYLDELRNGIPVEE